MRITQFKNMDNQCLNAYFEKSDLKNNNNNNIKFVNTQSTELFISWP